MPINSLLSVELREYASNALDTLSRAQLRHAEARARRALSNSYTEAEAHAAMWALSQIIMRQGA